MNQKEMTEYQIQISGVHYGANGDSVAGQKDTEEMHKRTLELLKWIDDTRPIIVLAYDESNPIHPDAVMARSQGRRIGRVAYFCLGLARRLLRQSGQQMVQAQVKEVVIKKHGHLTVTVLADELSAEPVAASAPEIEWQPWLSDLPQLPPSEQMAAQQEASFVLDNVLLPRLEEVSLKDLSIYLDLWLKSSCHDLSRETEQQRTAYIERLEAADDGRIRQLAEPLKTQRTSICGRKALDEHATLWWNERLESSEMQRLWQQWLLKTGKRLWDGLRQIDDLLRNLPGKLYLDIGETDVVLSRLYYMNTPRRALQSILALLMLRQLTCRELKIAMRPMTEDEYQRDGLVSNELEIPFTLGWLVNYAKTQCDRTQRVQMTLLIDWLIAEYRGAHCAEIDALTEPDHTGREQVEAVREQSKAVWEQVDAVKEQSKAFREQVDAVKEQSKAVKEQVDAVKEQSKAVKEQTVALNKNAQKSNIEYIYGDKNEFKEQSKLMKFALSADADPQEILRMITEEQERLKDEQERRRLMDE